MATAFRTALAGPKPYSWRNITISRMTFWSARRGVILAARFGQMPAISRSRLDCGRLSLRAAMKHAALGSKKADRRRQAAFSLAPI